jgi:hypothetical protein
MPETDIGQTDYGNLRATITDYSVSPEWTDGQEDTKETSYINTNWEQQFGYYKKIPELRAAIDALARWTIGKGFVANEITTLILGEIKGFGKDTFNSILENQIRVAKISGDSFAEIIRDKDRLVNLKPLDPGKMKIVANKKGLIIRYEFIGKGSPIKFEPDKIFHLSRNRTADEIHGESLINAVEDIILMRNEAMSDQRKIIHRYATPRIVYKLDTDETTKINSFKTKADEANKHGENLYIPKDAVEFEVLSVPANSTMNPLPWIDRLNNYFFQACGVPQIIVGGSQEMTEATAKIVYLAFEQTVSEEQLYLMEQVLAQLNLEIELEFPATLQNEMLSGQSKSETMQASTPEDTNVKGMPLRGAA